jgi:prevent-host-death family protein
MKRISIQSLKAQLSGIVSEAEAGSTILITRHNEPVARLMPLQAPHLHLGERVGAGRLKPALKSGTKGRYLTVLMEDRGSR